jgi:hypothetical protein
MPLKTKSHDTDERRYSAKLLFEHRHVGRCSRKRSLCEERIVTFTAVHARAALTEAKKRGRSARHSYKSIAGGRVSFEFLGILELLALDSACEQDEVWYELVQRATPNKRRRQLIPSEDQLHAIRNNE